MCKLPNLGSPFYWYTMKNIPLLLDALQSAAFDNFKANMEHVFTVNTDPSVKWW